MNKILFEGKKIKPESIEKIWREKNEIKAVLNGKVVTLARYRFEDWAELGLRYLEFRLGRRQSWP
jgi:hypothetical protein